MAPGKNYDRCCNPHNAENHKKTKSLRTPSKRLREKWGLAEDDRICVKCRKLCGELDAPININPMDLPSHHAGSSGESSSTLTRATEDSCAMHEDCDAWAPLAMELGSDIPERSDDADIEADTAEVLTQTSKLSELSIKIPRGESERSESFTLTQNSKSSELSINTLLPTINEGLAMLNQSPIPKRKLTIIPYLKEKVNRICYNLQRLLGVVENGEQSTDLNDIIDRLKAKYHSGNTTKAQKIQILTILPSEWSTTKVARIMGATTYMVKKAKNISRTKGILSMPDAKLGRPIPDETLTAVEQFYNDDRVSSNMPGMKDYVSSRNSANERIHIQKRLILSNLRELYEFFREDQPSVVIGFSAFASLRPKYCVLAGGSGTHTVCVCPIHQNVKLMMIGANFKRLTASSAHPLEHYSECLKLMTCRNPSPQCNLGECTNCPGSAVLHDTLKSTMEVEEIDNVVYKNWISVPRANLETLTKTTTEFIDDFCEKMERLLPHAFIAKEQSSYLKEKRESLQNDEFLVICDFAENYAFVVQDAAPAFHWNNDAATVYPVVIYFKENDLIAHKSLVIISDCLSHDTVAVYIFTKIIIHFIKEINQDAKKIYYFSDGAPQQFKNLKNFINLYYHKEDFGIRAEWHFFPTAHGKGPCDGVGGTVKRQAARASLQLPPDKQITKPGELYHWCSQPNHLPNITVKFSSQNNYDEMKEFLNARFTSAQTIPATLKIHCVIPGTDGNLFVKRFSRSEDFKCHRIVKNVAGILKNTERNPKTQKSVRKLQNK
ncbi:uncharacterized protein LOC107048461 [Diachasma alloeum]|uniref:uncharacterized protein LOC107048461 n=1 Tax=Diachasma alloeum TaxID=454923 RepID=UPI000738428D|nr:uncharacterized protein LOC107048461 [Diachasma alloeum]